MIGDFILWARQAWKEMFCIHDYKYCIWSKECKKCGRLK